MPLPALTPMQGVAAPAPVLAAPRASMTSGPVAPMLLRLTAPMVGGIMATLGYSVVETWFIGRLGAQALSAVSFTFPVTMVVISLAIGLGAGTSAVVARALGAGEAGARNLVVDGLLLAAAVGAAAALAGELLMGPLFRAMGAPDALLPLIRGYLALWFPAAALFMTAIVGLSAARAAGDARFQGAAMAGAAGINVLLVGPMIFGIGPFGGFGLRGAAVANLLAWSCLLCAALWRLRGLGLLGAPPSPARFLRSAQRIGRVGIPAAATNTIIPVSAGVVTAILATYGAEAVAGFGVAGRIESLAMVGAFALSAIMNPFAGQNAGAGRLDRVREAMRVTVWFCLAYGAALAVALWLAAPAIAALFTSDPAVQATVVWYLHVVPISFGASGIIAVVNSAFNGLNRPGAAVVVSVARMAVVNIPVAWLGGRLFGAPGVFLGVCVANILVSAGAAWWMWRVTASARPA